MKLVQSEGRVNIELQATNVLNKKKLIVIIWSQRVLRPFIASSNDKGKKKNRGQYCVLGDSSPALSWRGVPHLPFPLCVFYSIPFHLQTDIFISFLKKIKCSCALVYLFLPVHNSEELTEKPWKSLSFAESDNPFCVFHKTSVEYDFVALFQFRKPERLSFHREGHTLYQIQFFK